jgi:hypothetical protein
MLLGVVEDLQHPEWLQKYLTMLGWDSHLRRTISRRLLWETDSFLPTFTFFSATLASFWRSNTASTVPKEPSPNLLRNWKRRLSSPSSSRGE